MKSFYYARLESFLESLPGIFPPTPPRIPSTLMVDGEEWQESWRTELTPKGLETSFRATFNIPGNETASLKYWLPLWLKHFSLRSEVADDEFNTYFHTGLIYDDGMLARCLRTCEWTRWPSSEVSAIWRWIELWQGVAVGPETGTTDFLRPGFHARFLVDLDVPVVEFLQPFMISGNASAIADIFDYVGFFTEFSQWRELSEFQRDAYTWILSPSVHKFLSEASENPADALLSVAPTWRWLIDIVQKQFTWINSHEDVLDDQLRRWMQDWNNYMPTTFGCP